MKQLSFFITFLFLAAATSYAQGHASYGGNNNSSSAASYSSAGAYSGNNTGYSSNTGNSATRSEVGSRQSAQGEGYGNNYSAGSRLAVNTGYNRVYGNPSANARYNANAAYNNYTYGLKSNGAVNLTGWANRYSSAAKKPFIYYTSGISKSRSRSHYFDNVEINHHRPIYRPVAFSIPYYGIYYSCEYFYDGLLFEINNAYPVNSIKNTSLDGYIVYDQDTISGIVTLDHHSVYLEQPINEKKEYSYHALMNDKYLKSIALFRGSEELYLTHIPGDHKKMWRVLHSGKLMVYDDNYAFSASKNIDHNNMRILLPGHANYLDIESKKQFIWCINKAYGLHLKSKDFTWRRLFDYMDTLH